MTTTIKDSGLVYTPTEIANIGTTYIGKRRTDKDNGIPIGIDSLDCDFNKLLPGELVSIIARPGNGKSGFMMRWARTRAKWLQDNGIENKIVVYATWEQSVEELHAFNVAAEQGISITKMSRGEIRDDEWDKVLNYVSTRIQLPLWFIGHSVERRTKRPAMTVTALEGALRDIEGWNEYERKIDCIFVDYLQRVKFDGSVESKTIGTSDVLDRLKDMSLSFSCPVVTGVQATRDVDKWDLPIPTMDSGQWTSNVEQASDKVITLVRPRKYRGEGDLFGDVVVQGDLQMLVTIAKQKLGKDNWAKWVSFDPVYNRLDEMELRNAIGGE